MLFRSGNIEVASLKTNNKTRDRHLKSKSFFNVKKFPSISVESTESVLIGDTLNVTGNLIISGVTKDFHILFKYLMLSKEQSKQTDVDAITLTGDLLIDRRDYELTAYKRMIGNEIAIKLNLVFRTQPSLQ